MPGQNMDKYNFIKDSKRELEAFYARFFDSDDELQTFLSDAFDYENGSLARRQALFQVQRFISLANDIDKIRPGHDPLRILHSFRSYKQNKAPFLFEIL